VAHSACTRKIRNVKEILAGCSHRWEYNMERKFKGIRCEGLEGVHMAHDRDLRLVPQMTKIW
jgi:hypothetical protein